MGYSLDEADNVSFTGNLTLSGVSDGLHNVTVYAGDSSGFVGASETVSFTVASESFPYVIYAVSITVFVVVVMSAVLLFRRHRKTISHNKPNV